MIFYWTYYAHEHSFGWNWGTCIGVRVWKITFSKAGEHFYVGIIGTIFYSLFGGVMVYIDVPERIQEADLLNNITHSNQWFKPSR